MILLSESLIKMIARIIYLLKSFVWITD